MQKKIRQLAILPALLLSAYPVFAAQEIKLNHRSPTSLAAFLMPQSAVQFKELNRSQDFNQTLHVRFQQTYQGYRVWGGEGVMHIPHANVKTSMNKAMVKMQASMNGKMYEGLKEDLLSAPSYLFNEAQKQKAIEQTLSAYEKAKGKANIDQVSSELMVFIDKNHKAIWAFQIKFDVAPRKARALPERQIYIVDALNFEVYKNWNDIKTLDNVKAGGNGGNYKTGKKNYGGSGSHLPSLMMQRDATSQICYLQNEDAIVHDARNNEEVMNFPCPAIDQTHQVYWNGSHDSKNGGYSPSNDALYEGSVVKNLYQQWYGIPVLIENGKPMVLNMVVHEEMENAYWDSGKMVFGDGDGFLMFYPLTSLDVAAHEISHGFTEQHANLVYEGQSGGLNESFSDMASQAAYYFSGAKVSWKIGEEITLWLLGDALRYMDTPSKDCKNGSQPGQNCSIDSADQYNEGVDVHFSSGVYNRFFYLLSTKATWNVKKAFDVMVKANMHYWNATSDFQDAACGVISATNDYGYDVNAVIKSFSQVGIDTKDC